MTGPARALLGSAIVLTTLLAMVALASRGHVGADPAAGRLRPNLHPGAFAYVYAAFLVLGAVALPFFFYLYVRETPYSRKRRRRAWLAPFGVVAVVGLALYAAARWGEEMSEAIGRLQFWRDDSLPGPQTAGGRPPAPDWLPLAIVSAIAVTGGGALTTWRVLVRLRLPGHRRLAETLSAVVDDTLDDLHTEADARRAIIVAYARMESALERSGVARKGSEAPLEYLARVLIELEVSAAPARALTELFEHAKFSHHEIDDPMKDEAIEALQAIRAELREST